MMVTCATEDTPVPSIAINENTKVDPAERVLPGSNSITVLDTDAITAVDGTNEVAARFTSLESMDHTADPVTAEANWINPVSNNRDPGFILPTVVVETVITGVTGLTTLIDTMARAVRMPLVSCSVNVMDDDVLVDVAGAKMDRRELAPLVMSSQVLLTLGKNWKHVQANVNPAAEPVTPSTS